MNSLMVWQPALRYLRGKRGANVVPILSRISMVAIAFSGCAMIILLSVFNGMEALVRDMYTAFYPELKITPLRGKFFTLTDAQLASLQNTGGVQDFTFSIEDNVLANSNAEQRVAVLKGIDRRYFAVNDIKPHIDKGSDSVSVYPVPTAIVGRQLADLMGIEVNNAFSDITAYYPNASATAGSLSPTDAFQSLRMKPTGSFIVEKEFDSKYILTSLPLVQELLQAKGKYSSVEIKTVEGADIDDVRENLKNTLGAAYRVETRFEQNRTLYMVMSGEKWALYAILVLVLFIASFNMVGALSLLALEKQKDMAVLRTMGATPGTIRNIFVAEGMLWSVGGGIVGIAAGVLICLAQMQFGLIKIQGSYVIEAYPVKLNPTDFLLILFTIAVAGISASWFPAVKASKVEAISLKTD